MFTLLKLRCFHFYLFLVFNISWLQLSIYSLVQSFPLPSTSPMIHSASISLPKKAGLPRIFTQQSITSYSSEAENLYQGWMRKRVSWEEESEPSTPTVRNITQQLITVTDMMRTHEGSMISFQSLWDSVSPTYLKARTLFSWLFLSCRFYISFFYSSLGFHPVRGGIPRRAPICTLSPMWLDLPQTPP